MKHTPEIIPSLLSADFAILEKEIRMVEKAGCKKLHLDVMDGHFVPNITFGPVVIESIRKRTDLYLLAHLMIERPERFIKQFRRAGVNGVIIHQEVCSDFLNALKQIRKEGMQTGVALKPKTPIETIKDALTDLDTILIMSVEPGFGNQTYIKGSEEKIRQAKVLLQEKGVDIPIAVDGGINTHTAPLVVEAGATRLVAGSAIFAGDVVKNIKTLYKSIGVEK